MKPLIAILSLVYVAAASQAALGQATEKTSATQNAKVPANQQGTTANLGNVRVVKVEGRGAQLVNASGETSSLKEGSFIRQGTKILTGKDCNVVLLFDNGTTVNVEPESDFSIEKFSQDPFDASNVDYQTLKAEPSKSLTRLNIPEGSIIVDIAKLKKDSSFQIATPLGSAGIRGTSLGIRSNKSNSANPVSLGVATGVVQFKTPTGSRAVSGGQSFGIGSGGGFTPNPSGGAAILSSTSQTSAEMRQAVPAQPFQGAPPPAPAPPAAGSSLTAAQQQAVQLASEKGTDALVAAVEKLAAESPQAAAEIAAAAADALPTAATNVASAAATVAPGAAAQIAASVAQSAPSSAPQIAASVAAAAPAAAAQVAQSVASASPQAATAIAAAVIAAVPSANASAIQSATQTGAQQSNQPSTGSNQPANTGDQGSSTAGQSLPGQTGSASGSGSGTPPRPGNSSN
jgi:hypothetical protein